MSDLISRQAAIEAITDELDRIDHVPQWVFDRLEGRLKQLPPAQLGTNLAEVGTDTISRKAAVDGLNDAVHEHNITDFDAVATILALPSVTPKQRTGKWIRNGWAITCSECGYDMPYTVRNFCPNCGADMRGEQDDSV